MALHPVYHSVDLKQKNYHYLNDDSRLSSPALTDDSSPQPPHTTAGALPVWLPRQQNNWKKSGFLPDLSMQRTNELCGIRNASETSSLGVAKKEKTFLSEAAPWLRPAERCSHGRVVRHSCIPQNHHAIPLVRVVSSLQDCQGIIN